MSKNTKKGTKKGAKTVTNEQVATTDSATPATPPKTSTTIRPW